MPPQGDQCIFCQLISNPSQLKLVGETDNFYAWLDINPRAKGYTMIVSKEHKGSIEEFSASEYQEAMTLTRKVVDKAKKGLGADGVSVTMNIGEAAGQMVPHAYIQVFPRFKDRESAGTPTGAIFQPHEEAKQNLDSIRKDMASVDSDFGEKTKEPHPDSRKFKDEEETSEKSSNSDSSGSEKKEAIDKIAEQVESGGPLNLGASMSKGSKHKRKKSNKQRESAEEASRRTDKNDHNAEEDDEDEVRIDEDFEGKSFEWN